MKPFETNRPERKPIPELWKAICVLTVWTMLIWMSVIVSYFHFRARIEALEQPKPAAQVSPQVLSLPRDLVDKALADGERVREANRNKKGRKP